MDNGNMEQVYNEHAKQIYGFLLGLTHSADIAEELTQETFYRAVNSVDRYNGTCKISVWLCQIAKHVWYQHLAKGTKHKITELDENALDLSSIEDSAVLAEEKVILYKAIHLLGEPMKEVVLLRLSSELSFVEIGEIMERSENWARTTFYRAKQKLMEVL